MNFWSRNIDSRGRIIRIIAGVVFLIAAIISFFNGWILPTVLLGGSAVFVLYEGLRGWCAIRACGLKTPF